jgi:hypothetical protein
MKRWTTALLTLGMLALACSKSSTGPEENTGGSTGSTLSEEQAVANMVSGTLSDPGSFMLPGGMIGSMMGSTGMMGVQQGGCAGTLTPPNPVDNDADGVYQSATWSVDCDTVIALPNAGTYHIIKQGYVTMVDSNDADPWVGRVEVGNSLRTDNFFYYYFDYPNMPNGFHLYHKGVLSTNRNGNAYTVYLDYTWKAQVGDTVYGPIHYLWDGSFSPQNPSWNPATGRMDDGTLSMTGSMEYTLPTGATITLNLQTLTPVTYASTCNGGGPVSGSFRITWNNGQDVLDLQITGCNQFTATYNGRSMTVTPVQMGGM